MIVKKEMNSKLLTGLCMILLLLPIVNGSLMTTHVDTFFSNEMDDAFKNTYDHVPNIHARFSDEINEVIDILPPGMRLEFENVLGKYDEDVVSGVLDVVKRSSATADDLNKPGLLDNLAELIKKKGSDSFCALSNTPVCDEIVGRLAIVAKYTDNPDLLKLDGQNLVTERITKLHVKEKILRNAGDSEDLIKQAIKSDDLTFELNNLNDVAIKRAADKGNTLDEVLAEITQEIENIKVKFGFVSDVEFDEILFKYYLRDNDNDMFETALHHLRRAVEPERKTKVWKYLKVGKDKNYVLTKIKYIEVIVNGKGVKRPVAMLRGNPKQQGNLVEGTMEPTGDPTSKSKILTEGIKPKNLNTENYNMWDHTLPPEHPLTGFKSLTEYSREGPKFTAIGGYSNDELIEGLLVVVDPEDVLAYDVMATFKKNRHHEKLFKPNPESWEINHVWMGEHVAFDGVDRESIVGLRTVTHPFKIETHPAKKNNKKVRIYYHLGEIGIFEENPMYKGFIQHWKDPDLGMEFDFIKRSTN